MLPPHKGARADPFLCPHCGLPGSHSTSDSCIEALREAIRKEKLLRDASQSIKSLTK